MTDLHQAALARFLERLLLRSPLTLDERAAILGMRSYPFQASAQEDVVTPGAAVDHACLVVDGLIGRYDLMADGQRQITALHIAGDLCDLHSVASPVAGWGLEALTTSTLLQVPHADLRAIARKFPAIAMAFWRDTIVDASILAKWVGNLGRKNTLSRVAHVYCEMAMRSEKAGLGTRLDFPLPLKQHQLADVVGATTVHINRILQTLRKEGIVGSGANHFVHINDWNRLTEIADFNPLFLLM